jgi:hypothetical protein
MSSSDDESDPSPERSTDSPTDSGPKQSLKRKSESSLKSSLTQVEVAQGIRSGDFLLRANAKGRAEFWKSFSLVIDTAEGDEVGYVACNKCRVTFKHHRNSGTTSLQAHAASCSASTASQPKIEAFLSAKVPVDAKKKVARAAAQ